MKELSLILVSVEALWANGMVWDGWLFISPGEYNVGANFFFKNQVQDHATLSWPAIRLFYFPDWLDGPQKGDWIGRIPSFPLPI
jgi:hypothetical protein